MKKNIKKIKERTELLINSSTRYHVVEWLPCSKRLHGSCICRALLSNGQEVRVGLVSGDITFNFI